MPQESQNDTSIAPSVPSPLGVDPTPVVNTEAPKPVVAEPAARGKQLTQEQYDELQQKASNYDLISSDPELSVKVIDHYKAKTGRVGTPAQAKTTPQEPQQDNSEDERFRALSRKQAEIDVKLFKLDNPDMDLYKEDMARLVGKYNMSLDDAYRFSKAAKSQAAQKPVKEAPVTPTTETNHTAGSIDVSEADIGDVEKRINDPKATPHMDDAIALAWQTAKRRSARSNSE